MSAVVLPFIRIDVRQNTPEWFAARAGLLTGSKADCITAKPRSGDGEATTRRDYRIQLALERVTGRSLDEGGFQSWEMRWGKENEPLARYAYEARTGLMTEEFGFARHLVLPAGCSLDGWVEDDPEGPGFIEIKCPKSATHLEYLERARIPPEYLAQLTHNFWITEAAWCDFVSFDPRMPGKARTVVVRVYRHEVNVTAHQSAAVKFLAEVKTTEVAIQRKAA